MILDIKVTDPEEYTTYRERSGATVERYGGRYLVRGGQVETMEGDWQPGRVVVLEFPSAERAKEWYGSPEYQEILPIRLKASNSVAILVEGV
jgi:uncharacterized protein (DUF1330 family)